ncbi:kinase domain protein [Stachybotrys elegans]|uniref:Kinase domain protein n=1 Tax=Stachybotrys elegans TaxID=80388 RepID=A0A8K0T490_9HYPO|nr:kinase domain protein [Stachybotrys elegans]
MACAWHAAKLRSLWKKPSNKLPPYLTRSLATLASESSSLISEPIDEEHLHSDRLKYFYPTKPGETLAGKYKTISKLGFGGASTVWLAENVHFQRWKKSSSPRYVSIKIPALDTDGPGEAAKLKVIASADPSHPGLSYVRVPIDTFQLQGPQGTHLCLVYQPMRETLYQFQRRMPRQRLLMMDFKLFLHLLLQALDYLHTGCNLIHTDIKDENILMTIEDEQILSDFASHCRNNPQPRHIRAEDGRVTYLAEDDLGPLYPRGVSNVILPMLSDFSASHAGLDGRSHIFPTQSHCYRAPEVLLGCPWTYSIDIWNVGLLMWDLLEDTTLFGQRVGYVDGYDAHVHLARMVSLLGPPPEQLIERERAYRKLQLGFEVVNSKGEKCGTMNEFWGGPFFDDNGDIIRKDLLEGGRPLADTVTELSGEEKVRFLDFASQMLQWLPEKRKTARELLQHPFFHHGHEKKEQDRCLEMCAM